MGNIYTKELDMSDYQSLEAEFQLSQDHIRSVYERFVQLDRRQCGSLSPPDFMRIPHLALNPLRNRLIGVLFSTYEDCNWKNVNEINFRHFLSAYALFVSPTSGYNTEAEKQKNMQRRQLQLRAMSRLFDSQGKGFIDRADLTEMVYMQCRNDNTLLNTNRNSDNSDNSDEAGKSSVEATNGFEVELAEMLKIFFDKEQMITYEVFEETLTNLKFHEAMEVAMLGISFD